MILIPNTDFDDHNTLRCHKVCRVIKSIIFLSLKLLKWNEKGNIKLSLEKVYVTCVYMLINWRKFKFSMRAWENIVCMCHCVSSSNPVMTLATRGVFVIIPANNCFMLPFTYDGHMYLYTHMFPTRQPCPWYEIWWSDCFSCGFWYMYVPFSVAVSCSFLLLVTPSSLICTFSPPFFIVSPNSLGLMLFVCNWCDKK